MRRPVGAGLVALAVAGATVVAASCTPATSPLELAGVYPLVSVNGAALPYLVQGSGSARTELIDDAFTLHPGGTYAENGQTRTIAGGSVTYAYPVDAGNFTRRGDRIALESLVSTARRATIRDGTLTLVADGLTLVYRK